MNAIDKLTRDYKLETRQGIKKVRLQKKIDLVSFVVGMCIGVAILAVLFHFDLKWYFGRNVPWFIDFFAVFALTINVHVRPWASYIILAAWAIGLVAVFADLPLPLVQ